MIRWNKFLTLKGEIIKFLEDNVGKFLHDLGGDRTFQKCDSISTKGKDWLINYKILSTQITEEEKIFASHTMNKNLIFKIY